MENKRLGRLVKTSVHRESTCRLTNAGPGVNVKVVVARINFGKSVAKALNYNEHKCKQGDAQLIGAANTLLPVESMNFYEKRSLFEKYTVLNQRSSVNSLHVSLNFDPSERIEKDKFLAIAASYMEGIGFGEQPYFVYQHHDTGHPHIHIVSTTIQSNGRRIATHNLGREKSEPIRKQIEVDFGLVVASSKSKQQALTKAVAAKRIAEGPRQTKRAIAHVLQQVLTRYSFCSLTELNALLGLYNIKADRCAPGSFTHRHGGLLFRVLDAAGRPSGTPIKASLFAMKPTLRQLEKMFAANLAERKQKLKGLTSKIDFILGANSVRDLGAFRDRLEKAGLSLVERVSVKGELYGLTYIDHKAQIVVNGSDLGPGYAAMGIQARLLAKIPIQQDVKSGHAPSESLDDQKYRPNETFQTKQLELFAAGSEAKADYIPWQLRGRKRKKRQKK